jgi:AraC family transcriptional regulator of arabinose operon
MTLRTNRVRKYLVESQLSIKEISAELDYASPFYFSRQFRSINGMTPTEYHDQHTKKEM